jgi:hypothetical protein
LTLQEEQDFEEIVIEGFSIINLTSTMKEQWTKEVQEDAEYQKRFKKVKIKEKNVEEKF